MLSGSRFIIRFSGSIAATTEQEARHQAVAGLPGGGDAATHGGRCGRLDHQAAREEAARDQSASGACQPAQPLSRRAEEGLTEPALFGKARLILSDAAYPSANPVEWLNDNILANGHAADERPEGAWPVEYNYPAMQALVPPIFTRARGERVLQQRGCAVIQQFCDGCHWHNLVLIGPEARAYYWDPLHANALPRRSPIRVAFDAAAPDGWEFESIYFQAQADGHSCGDWSDFFRCRVLAYMADSALVGTRTFPAFLVQGLTNIKPLRGTARSSAESSQRRIARLRRDALRYLLRAAAQRGALKWGEVRVEDFTRIG